MVAQGLIIKRANTNDAGQLRELSVSTFQDTFGPPVNKQEDMDRYIADQMSLEQLSTELEDDENLFFLAYYENILIGYVKLRAKIIPPELAEYHPIEIERLYVVKEYLGKKAGATLMNYCIAYATKHNYDMVWLGVWEHNYKALDFYKKFGFELFGSHPFILGDDVQTDALMKRPLR
jgi:hypothetical protein